MSNKKYYIENPFLHVAVISAAVISFFFFDKPLAQFFYTKHIPSFIAMLTHLGTFWLYLIPLAIIIFVYKFVGKKQSSLRKLCFLWLNIAIPCLSCLALKMCLGRARPILWFTKNIYGFYGPSCNELYWSCPSGHTTTIMSLALGLTFLFPRQKIMVLTLGLLVASSRVLLTQHYLSDVFIAIYLVLISNYILIHIYKNFLPHKFISSSC